MENLPEHTPDELLVIDLLHKEVDRLQALTERQAKEIELLTTENSIHRKSESELTKRLSQQLSEKTAEVERKREIINDYFANIQRLNERVKLLEELLKEALDDLQSVYITCKNYEHPGTFRVGLQESDPN